MVGGVGKATASEAADEDAVFRRDGLEWADPGTR
jgi:hypothetical protein